MRIFNVFFTVFLFTIIMSCSQKSEENSNNEEDEKLSMIEERISAYAPTVISADVSHLTENQKRVLEMLVEAGKVADEIFWMQNTPDAIEIRDSLANSESEESDTYLEYVKINYGPYDEIHGLERFVGEGPSIRPKGGNFYPTDLTVEELEAYMEANPEKEEFLTIVDQAKKSIYGSD